jgi:quercetin dioxygenase-like cupin family protein
VMAVGEERQEVTAGDAIWLPRGVPHSLTNDGDEDCVILVAAAAI